MAAEDCTAPDYPIRRLLMTADPIGGVWSYALELVEALQRYEVEVILATMGAPLQDSQRAAAQGVKNLILCESTFKLEWMDSPWPDVTAAGSWLLELEARMHPDIVHLNGYVHAALSWRAPTLVVGHSCVFSWFAAVRGTPPPSTWTRYHREVSRGLRCAALVTAPTEAMLTALNTHHGRFAAARAVYNGRRASAVCPGRKEPFILAIGRLWDEAKNIACLDAAAPALNWPVYVAGDARHPDGGVAPLRAVHPLGQLAPAALAGWLRRAAIFALPARYEPFGLAALEAGLAGCALVLGDIPRLREVWDEAALFVPPDEPTTLAAVLQALMRDALWCRRLGRQARARALLFTPKRMAQGYWDLYAQILRAHPIPGVDGSQRRPGVKTA